MTIEIETLTTLADPYPVHAELRERGTHQLDDGRWLVAGADEVESVLADNSAVIGFDATDAAASVQSRMARFTDGPPHTDRRSVATSALDRIDATWLRTHAFEATTAILAGNAAVDLIATIARAVPVAVLASALGLPDPAAAESAVALAMAIAPPRGRARGDAESPARQILAMADTTGELTDAEINTAALLFQAVDATAGLIGNSVVTAARLGAPSADAVLEFVAEVSRFDPAVHFTTRRTIAAIDLGALTVPTGSVIVVDLAAAGRDPSRCDHPDEFRATRGAASLAFGDGTHRCPGRDEALALATGVVTAILDSGGELRTDEITYEPRFNLRVPTSLSWSH